MRFAFISAMSGYPWGGSEELWSQAALRLRDQGHDVAASVRWWPQLSPKVIELGERGVAVFAREPVRHTLPQRLWRKVARRKDTPRDLIWLRRQNPDLVVISQGRNGDGLEWMKLCQEGRVPFAAIVQGNTESWWPNDEEGKEVAKAYSVAKKVFCVSRHNLELLERQIAERLPNAAVVWNPYSVPTDEPLSWPANDGVWKLACVARLEPAAKGQDVLFQVLTRPQWRERALEVNLYGTGPWEQSLKKLANCLQIKNLHFRGHVANVRNIWEDNHLLVLPSRFEGLPLALVEAMWCGRPAVVTDVGGNAELCLDNETGFVAAAPTLGFVEEALERAWNRRADWQRMGLAARARADQLIPKDVVCDFCQDLMECVQKQAQEITNRKE
jgi:glycosyltransferase involved in cell wall biosynthesis